MAIHTRAQKGGSQPKHEEELIFVALKYNAAAITQ
jgi:hypothetical protein